MSLEVVSIVWEERREKRKINDKNEK